MAKRVERIMKNYSDRDYNALLSIYKFRCLSFEQIYDLHYKFSGNKKVTSEYCRKKIIRMRKDNLIEESNTSSKKVPSVYFLTNDGIQAVRLFFNLPSNIYDKNNRVRERGYYTYSEIKIADRFIPHQYNLNKFAMNSISFLGVNNIPYSYVDERHVSETYGIRPDGILSFCGIDIFLEMDMGTESLAQLKSKWNHYRNYMHSQNYIDNGKKIIIFFICNNKGNIKERIKVIKSSLNDNFIDCLEEIDVYVGIPEKLMSVLKNIIVPSCIIGTNEMYNSLVNSLTSHKFKVASGTQMSKYLNNISYTFYIKNES